MLLKHCLFDIKFDKSPPTLFVRAEYTKIKVDRTIFLTEVTRQIQSWLDYKYRTRICHQDEQQGKTITEYRTPIRKMLIWCSRFIKILTSRTLISYTMILANRLQEP